MSETYEVELKCTNCDTKGTATIPKGTTVEAWLQSDSEENMCSECGCCSLKRPSKPVHDPFNGMVPCNITINGDDINNLSITGKEEE